jgi:hypothetical protein
MALRGLPCLERGPLCGRRLPAAHHPTKTPGKMFKYVDIGSIDNNSQTIANPKIIDGANAPSRARGVIIRRYPILYCQNLPASGTGVRLSAPFGSSSMRTAGAKVRVPREFSRFRPFQRGFRARIMISSSSCPCRASSVRKSNCRAASRAKTSCSNSSSVASSAMYPSEISFHLGVLRSPC